MEQIACKECTSPYCNGCNIYRLERMLMSGKLDALMGENRTIKMDADVLPRDEAIKMGAELAAMHGSDATSQQLEEAYLKGVEYGMTRRDVRPVVFCGDCTRYFGKEDGGYTAGYCKRTYISVGPFDFCSRGEKRDD